MEEKRKHPRTEIDEPAYVSSGGSVMRCVVRNISREGAAIDVENPAFVPQRFRLVMAKDSSIVHECRVAWIKQNRIGLTFMNDRGRSCGTAAIVARRRARYSILSFASRTTLPHFSISSLMRAPNSSGLLATGLKPSAMSRSFTSGWATALAISR